MPTTREDIQHWFTYHSPTPLKALAYQELRDAAKVFAEVVLQHVPPCPDQTVAFRRLREVVMIANQAIACDGR